MSWLTRTAAPILISSYCLFFSGCVMSLPSIWSCVSNRATRLLGTGLFIVQTVSEKPGQHIITGLWPSVSQTTNLLPEGHLRWNFVSYFVTGFSTLESSFMLQHLPWITVCVFQSTLVRRTSHTYTRALRAAWFCSVQCSLSEMLLLHYKLSQL